MGIQFKIGMRTLKTLIAVAICIITLSFVGVQDPFFACIATIFVIQGDKDGSVKNAKNRVWGTAYGSIVSNIVLVCLSFLPYNAYVQTLATCLSIFLVIQMALFFKKPAAIFPGCIVLCAILCTTTNIQTPLLYAIKRTAYTLYGAIVGLVINLYVCPYQPTAADIMEDLADEIAEDTREAMEAIEAIEKNIEKSA
ncbi:MAG: aromatic acid exporter family protein [Niameybacter sp.]